MTSSVRTTLESLDFKDEEDDFAAKFENPNFDDTSIAKCQVIAAVAEGNTMSKMRPENIVSVDLEEYHCDQSSKDVNSDGSLPSYGENVKVDSDKINRDTKSDVPLSLYRENATAENSISRAFFYEAEMRLCSPEETSAGRGQSDHALTDSPCSNELYAEKRMEEYAVTTSDSDCGEDGDSLNDHVSNGCSSGSEMDEMEESIVVTCDYIIYQGDHRTGLLVMFSPAGIKIYSSGESETKETFDMGWKIDDIVSVKCQWFSRVGQALISLSLLTKDAVHGHNVSGFIEAKLAVDDHHWPYTQQEIMALNAKYMAVWSYSLETGSASAAPRPYFPNFDQSFEEVVYPKGDRDAVSINKRDVDLLQPQTFVNDNIIDFYAKYLKNKIAPEDVKRFHFFNSFFFRKLADLDRDPSLAADGKAAFMRVRKWTRKVDIFGKDYIFIPVNFNLHWSLLVICHPGEVASFKDEDLDKSPKVPCILHMDSIKGTHAGLKNLMQSYLYEEWRERQGEVSEDICSKFLHLRFVHLELPQQENSFDCGLFLLHYLELFLAEAPAKFNPFKITKHSNFLNVNWFPPLEASLKRTMLQKLIFELLDHHLPEVSPAAEHVDNLSRKKFDDGNGIESLSKGPDAPVACQETFPDSHVDQGIEITLLGSSSLRSSHCANESGLVLREFFESGAPSGSLLGQFQSFEHPMPYYSALSPIEEDDAKNGEHFAYPSNTEFGEMTDMGPQGCDDSYICGSFGGETSCKPGTSEQADNKEVFRTQESLKLNCEIQNNGDTVEDYHDEKDITPCQQKKIDQQRSSPVQLTPCVTDGHDHNPSVQVEGLAQEGSDLPENVNKSTGDSSCQDNMGVTSNPECDRIRKRVHEDLINCDSVSGEPDLSEVDEALECQEKQALKKLRLAPSQEVQESG